jgi:hypothetical protein
MYKVHTSTLRWALRALGWKSAKYFNYCPSLQCLGFFHKSVSPGPLSILLGLLNFMKIRGDIRNFVFIAGNNDTVATISAYISKGT